MVAYRSTHCLVNIINSHKKGHVSWTLLNKYPRSFSVHLSEGIHILEIGKANRVCSRVALLHVSYFRKMDIFIMMSYRKTFFIDIKYVYTFCSISPPVCGINIAKLLQSEVKCQFSYKNFSVFYFELSWMRTPSMRSFVQYK